MIHRTPLAVVFACATALAAPVWAQDDVTESTVVATVNGTDITVGHMLVVAARLPQQYQQLENQVLFDGILDQLVQQTLLGQTADGLTTANERILQNEERALLSSQAIADAARTASTDEAVAERYAADYAEAGGETEYNASHILVETEEEAQELVTELDGGADFATLAQERSTGPSGPNGGMLGWFGPGMMVAPFEEAVFTLEPGQVSEPVQTQFGWHVIILNETRQTEAPTLEEVRDDIVDTLQREAVESLVAELEAQGTVDRILPGALDPAVIRDITLIEN